jgi:xanthine dehydrogenase accessory factor
VLKALVKGAGDLGSAVALSLHHAGFAVLMTELPAPLAIRRTVCFSEAVYDGEQTVEGVRAVRTGEDGLARALAEGLIAVLVDPAARACLTTKPDVLVDATMAKANRGTRRGQAAIVVALGPGFEAGKDADAVVETMRGHELGRVIREGRAQEDTGVPGEIVGRAAERVLRAPRPGLVAAVRKIGDILAQGEEVVSVGGEAVHAAFSGCLRGLIRPGILVAAGAKIGDVDPRGDPRYCGLVSDKARAVGRAVLEAVLLIGRERDVLRLTQPGAAP